MDLRSINFLIILVIITFSNSLSQIKSDKIIEVLQEINIFPHDLFDACHASTIVETSPGVFFSAWFAGSYEGAEDVGIWISEYKDDHWRHPQEIAVGLDSSGNPLPCWNPVLFKTNNNNLYLFYKVGPNPREWWGCFIRSSDNGKNWDDPEKLPNGFLGPIKNKPVQLENGNILCPSSVETTNGRWTIHLEITNEDLSRWEKIEIESDSMLGVIQPAIIQHRDGSLQMLCRSRQNFIYQTWSHDSGMTWTKLSKTSMPNPNSGIDAVSTNNGEIVLVYNPLNKGDNWWNGRNKLNVALSNNGINWEDIYQLENEEEGEFSYPAVIQAKNKSIHITYTAKRKTIKHLIFKIK